MDRTERLQTLHNMMRDRIFVIDGSWGALLQGKGLEEADYRGERFADHPLSLKNDVDVLNITLPDIVREVHDAYFEAGADIGTTNTFTSTSVTQEDFRLDGECYELNLAGARLARERADAWTEQTPDKPRWVAGSMGPTNKTSSVAIEVSNPGLRGIDFDPLKDGYVEAARGLVDGGADILLIETIYDTLNAKAAVVAVEELREELGLELPIILSWTATDLSGRNLSGQTVDAFWNSIRHAKPLAVGLNCAFGAEELRSSVLELARVAEVPIAAYPNAGLPNDLGEFDETPEITARHLNEWAESGLVNIVGGCCGTTPEHIRQIASKVSAHAPRAVPDVDRRMRLAGIDAFEVVS
jgi:5-methyltetrahydrofolate--homocysteine methyltransferase